MTPAQIKSRINFIFATTEADLVDLKLTAHKKKIEIMKSLVFEGLDLLDRTTPDQSTSSSIDTGAAVFYGCLEVLHEEAGKSWAERGSEKELDDLVQKLYSSLMSGKGFIIRNAKRAELIIQVNDHGFFQGLQVLRSMPQEMEVKPENQEESSPARSEDPTNHAGTERAMVFVSHASEDKELVEALGRHLLPAVGLNLHNDIFCTSLEGIGIGHGKDWRKDIYDHIHSCKLVVAIVSGAFNLSDVCLNEIGAAWILDKPILPLIVPPLNKGNVGVLDVLQQKTINDSDELDSFQDAITDILGTKSKLNVAVWNSGKNSFLNAIADLNLDIAGVAKADVSSFVQPIIEHPKQLEKESEKKIEVALTVQTENKVEPLFDVTSNEYIKIRGYNYSLTDKVLACLQYRSRAGLSLNQLVRCTGIMGATLISLLSELEMKGVVAQNMHNFMTYRISQSGVSYLKETKIKGVSLYDRVAASPGYE